MKKTIQSIILSGLILAGPACAAEPAGWVLLPDESKVAYGTIKQGEIGEVNHFKKLSGSVSDKGDVKIDIDLMSLETNVDTRNERMQKYVFDSAHPTATLKAHVDMDRLEALSPGEVAVIETEGTLSFLTLSVPIDASMAVARLDDDKVLVSTNDMIMITTDDLGVDAGVDKLMELAGLSEIARAVPVTLRFVFEKPSKD